MSYIFKASETFWRNFYALTPAQKEATRDAWDIFKTNPFDPRLGTHQIRRLSSKAGRTVYAVVIKDDLRLLFFIKGNAVYSFDIGTHDVYKQ